MATPTFSTTAEDFKIGSHQFLYLEDSGTTATITGITAANPPVVTATSHGFSDDDRVRITGVVGMTEVNGLVAVVDNSDANTFELKGVQGSGWTAYSSGGTAEKLTETDMGITAPGSVLTVEETYREETADQTGTTPIDKVLVGEKVTLSVGFKKTSQANLAKLRHAATLVSTTRIAGGGKYAGSVRKADAAFCLVLHPMNAADDDNANEWTIPQAMVTGPIANPLDHTQSQQFPANIEGVLDTRCPVGEQLWRFGP
jgi:hypothetical protein